MKIQKKEIVITPELYEEILIETGHLYDFLDCNSATYTTRSSMFLNKINMRLNCLHYSRKGLIKKVIETLYRVKEMDVFKGDIKELGFPYYYEMKKFYSK